MELLFLLASEWPPKELVELLGPPREEFAYEKAVFQGLEAGTIAAALSYFAYGLYHYFPLSGFEPLGPLTLSAHSC